MKKILMMAGGTGGHVFPALAVADALKAEGHQINWLGTRAGIESRLVPDDYTMITLPVKALRGRGVFKKLFALSSLCLAVLKAYRIMSNLKPDLVVGMGGYASGPGGLAAWLCRVPLLIHEQNAVAGFTNRCLAHFSRRILQAYPGAFSHNKKAMTVGNPVRSALSAIAEPALRLKERAGPLRVLVLGGSQGAHVINECVLSMLSHYPDRAALSVWHQSGASDFSSVGESYQRWGIHAKVDAFIDDVVQAYEWADVVLCRAGALTVSEIAAVGLAAIFIPYPHAVDDHQWHNSRFLEEAGAALVIRQAELTPACLIDLLQQFSQDRLRLLRMSQKARALGQPGATGQVVAVCHQWMGA